MTNSNCTTSSKDFENFTYPTLVVSNVSACSVAEETGDYSPNKDNPAPFSWEVKKIQLRALQTTGFGQIGRLYQLATLLRESEMSDWDAETFAGYAKEIQDATGQLETLLCDIVDPLLGDSDKEELDDD